MSELSRVELLEQPKLPLAIMILANQRNAKIHFKQHLLHEKYLFWIMHTLLG